MKRRAGMCKRPCKKRAEQRDEIKKIVKEEIKDSFDLSDLVNKVGIREIIHKEFMKIIKDEGRAIKDDIKNLEESLNSK